VNVLLSISTTLFANRTLAKIPEYVLHRASWSLLVPTKCTCYIVSDVSCLFVIICVAFISNADLKSKYPAQYSALAKCLDYNDFRFDDCKVTKNALLEAWNSEIKQ
jgi:hypothetical protein